MDACKRCHTAKDRGKGLPTKLAMEASRQIAAQPGPWGKQLPKGFEGNVPFDRIQWVERPEVIEVLRVWNTLPFPLNLALAQEIGWKRFRPMPVSAQREIDVLNVEKANLSREVARLQCQNAALVRELDIHQRLGAAFYEALETRGENIQSIIAWEFPELTRH